MQIAKQVTKVYRPEPENKFHYVLRKLFEIPSVVLVGGVWKTGKTDFALFIAETLLKLKSHNDPRYTVISEAASNIDTKGALPMVADLVSLRRWLYETRRKKLFIFDEANVHLPSRRAMSNKNVEIVRLLGEVSKAHARMIVVAQELLRVDKEFLNPTWVRAAFIKKSLKKAVLVSHMLPKQYVFRGIPATSIPFDPYAVAPFTEKPADMIVFKDEEMQKYHDWCKLGRTWRQLGFNHPQQFNRFLRKIGGKLIDYRLSHITSNSVED